MARKFLTHIDLAKNELQNAVIQQLASDPGSPVQGQIYYNTGDDTIYVYTGSAWEAVGTGAGTGDVVGPASATNNAIVRFDDTTGKLVQDSVVTIADTTGVIAGTEGITFDGTSSGTTAVVATAAASGTITLPAATDTLVGKATTDTLTNKTIDANGTGNSISNLEVADFASGVVDTTTTLGTSDTVLPTQIAVKTYVDNQLQGLSWKTAVRAATTAAVTLATDLENADTLDGVTLATGDRILVKNQADQTENGVYIVAASGAPTRATDANSGAELVNATVFVAEGTANADKVYTQTTNATITIGASNVVFAEVNGGTVPAASTTVAGKVELATQAEAEAKTDTDRALTAVSVVNFPIKKTFTIGDGAETSYTLTHSLGTKEVMTQVRQAADDVVVECDIVNTSTSAVTLTFTVAPASNAIKAVVIG
jgi:hypothetical protein